MNFKQKLVYMLIGSLFTIAGYLIASLANNQPQEAHAQENNIFDKIVCTGLVVVDTKGNPVIELNTGDLFGGGKISVRNRGGKNGLIMEAFGGGMINVYDCIKGERRVGIWGKADVGDAGMVAVYGNNQINPVVVMRKSITSGGGVITVANEENKVVATMGSNIGTGYMSIHAKDGKTLVSTSSKENIINDGLIKVYNHKGEWRSISKD